MTPSFSIADELLAHPDWLRVQDQYAPQFSHGELKSTILGLLSNGRKWTIKKVAATLDSSRANVGQVMRRMYRDKLILRVNESQIDGSQFAYVINGEGEQQ